MKDCCPKKRESEFFSIQSLHRRSIDHITTESIHPSPHIFKKNCSKAFNDTKVALLIICPPLSIKIVLRILVHLLCITKKNHWPHTSKKKTLYHFHRKKIVKNHFPLPHSGQENLKQSRPKKLVTLNKSISRIFLWSKYHFLHFQKWSKINYWTWEKV